MPAVKYKEISSETKGETSTEIRERVIRARKIQYERFANLKNVFNNGDMGSNEVRQYCTLDSACSDLLKMGMTKLGFSARAYDGILKVTYIIVDLDCEVIYLLFSNHNNQAHINAKNNKGMQNQNDKNIFISSTSLTY